MQMAYDGKDNQLFKFIRELASKGRYTFSFEDFLTASKASNETTRQMLSRGLKRKSIVSPAKGFYVVVPPEYQALGCLEASEFIPHLMSYWKEDYYVSLLSAAAIHGAAHHAPMTFQVMTKRVHRPIKIGKVSVNFYLNKYVGHLPIVIKNTRKSTLKVASPETTAFDLVARFRNSGGFGNMITVLSELAEKLHVRVLNKIAKDINEIAYIQRLGYILDFLGFEDKANGLLKILKNKSYNYSLLVPYKDKENATSNSKWKIIENEKVESEV